MSYKAKYNIASDGKLFEQGKVYDASEVETLDLTNFELVDEAPTATPDAGTFSEKKENADGGTASSLEQGNVSTSYAPEGSTGTETSRPKEALE